MDQIKSDIACGQCGETLKSLTLRDACRCGKPVTETISDTIAHWGVSTLSEMEVATRWVAWTAVGFLTAVLLLWLDNSVSFHATFGGQIFAIGAAWYVWSVWKFTAIPREHFGRREKLIRAGAVIFMAAVAFELMERTGLRFYFPSMLSSTTLELLISLFLFGLVLFQMQLGGRLADLREAAGTPGNQTRSASAICWIGILALSVGFTAQALALIPATEGAFSLIYPIMGIVALVGSLVALIGYACLLVAWFRFLSRVVELRTLAQVLSEPKTA